MTSTSSLSHLLYFFCLTLTPDKSPYNKETTLKMEVGQQGDNTHKVRWSQLQNISKFKTSRSN